MLTIDERLAYALEKAERAKKLHLMKERKAEGDARRLKSNMTYKAGEILFKHFPVMCNMSSRSAIDEYLKMIDDELAAFAEFLSIRKKNEDKVGELL